MTSPVILVVDDAPAIRQMFVDWFCSAKQMKIADFEVMEAKNGVEALEKIAVKKPDLVITDIAMPLMNGFQLIEKLHILYTNLPIMVITALDHDVTQNRLTEMREQHQINWVFLKPLSMTSVLTKIMSLVAVPAGR